MDHAVMNLPFGGRDISKLINEYLTSKNVSLSSVCPDIQDIIHQIKEKLVCVNPQSSSTNDFLIHESSQLSEQELKDNAKALMTSDSTQIDEESYFELPDETLIKFDKMKLYQWGEAVVNPQILNKQNCYFLPDLLNLVDCFKDHSNFFMDHKQQIRNLHEYLFASIEMCDNDFHKLFNGNILISGGVSDTRGLFQKFKTVKKWFFCQIYDENWRK